MTKFTKLMTLMVCLFTLFGLQAQTTGDYVQKFDTWDSQNPSFAPEGWGHKVGEFAVDFENVVNVSYKIMTTNGQDGAYLKVGSQLLEYQDWGTGQALEKVVNDYLITPAIDGTVSVFLKKNGEYSTANVKVFNCTKSGTSSFSIGTLVKEIKDAELNATTWTEITLPAVEKGALLAFRFDNVSVDEYTVKAAPAPAAGYLEKFDNLNVSAKADFAPKDWGRIADKFTPNVMGADAMYVSYKNPTTEGQDGAYLSVGSQFLEYQDWYDPYAYDSKKVNDYIVTPLIGGDVSFYLKKMSSSKASVKIFKATRNGGKFVVGELVKEVTDAELNADKVTWTKFTIPAVPAKTSFAIRLENVGIDEFSAETMEVEAVRAMEIVSVKCTSGRDATTGADNKFEAAFDVTLKNTGNVELTPGTTNYSLTILRTEGGKDVEIVTVPVNIAIQPGTTGIAKISAKIDAGNKEESLKYSIRENLNNQVKFGSWIDTKPYAPEMKLAKEDGYEYKATDVLDFGLLKSAPVTKSFTVVNNGFAPLNITAITLPEGYTTTFAVPAVVPSEGQTTVEVTLSNEKAGTFSGKVAVTADVVGTKEVNVIGAVIDPNAWYEDFEKPAAPSNMLFGENWKISSYPVILGTETNKQWAENGVSSDPTLLVTPLLRVKAGQSFTLRAAKRNASSVMNVYYSADRINWQLASEVAISEFTDEKAGSSYDNYKFTMMSFNQIPEGDWYIGIEGGYVRVDDMFGYELVAVEHDFYINSVNLPGQGMVNYPSTATISVKNMANLEAAGAYAVKLYVNNEMVAEAAAEEFAQGDKTFEVNFTPHEAGTFLVYFEVSAGDVVVNSIRGTITVNEETAEGANKVEAEVNPSLNNNQVPVRLFYKKSESQTIYTAEKLAAAGVTSGAQIIKLAYDGYCTSSKELVSNISIYLENTTDVNPDATAPKDLATMTLVFSGDVNFLEGGSSTAPVQMLAAPFNAPFEYTGQNLRVAVVARATGYKQVYFETDNDVKNAAIYKSSDSNIETATWNTAAMPLVNIYTQREVPTLSGKVYSEVYGALPNVKVKLISGDVLYTAVTDEQGMYSMSVFQSTKDFQAVIDEIPGYEAYTHAELVNLSAGSQVVDFCVSPLSGVENVEFAGLAVYGAKGCIVVKAAAAETVNVYNIAGRLVRSLNVEEGTTTVDGLMAGFYIVNGTKVLVR